MSSSKVMNDDPLLILYRNFESGKPRIRPGRMMVSARLEFHHPIIEYFLSLAARGSRSPREGQPEWNLVLSI